MNELTTQQRITRLQLHEAEWLQAQYDAEINHEVATELGDADLLKHAKQQMIRAEKALKVIREKIEDIQRT